MKKKQLKNILRNFCSNPMSLLQIFYQFKFLAFVPITIIFWVLTSFLSLFDKGSKVSATNWTAFPFQTFDSTWISRRIKINKCSCVTAQESTSQRLGEIDSVIPWKKSQKWFGESICATPFCIHQNIDAKSLFCVV